MEDYRSLEDFDLELFEMFESTFAFKYPDMFRNKKLFNSWGRKCNFIINSLKNVILKKEKDILVQKVINTLIEFLADKEITTGLKYFSSFNNELFSTHKQEMLSFRNSISTCIFSLIDYNKETKKYRPPINEEIGDLVNTYLKDYDFLKSLFDLVEYSLNTDDIYNEYLSLLNNSDILKVLINHKNCILNIRQKEFIISNKFKFSESHEFLVKLKALTMSNDNLIKELKNINNKKKKKKYKNKKEENNKLKENNNITHTNNTNINYPKDTSNNKQESKKEDFKIESNKENDNITHSNNINIDYLIDTANNKQESKKEDIKIESNNNKESKKEIKIHDLNQGDINEISNTSLTEKIKSLEKVNELMIKKIKDLEATIVEERERNKKANDELKATIVEERERNKKANDELKATIVEERERNKKTTDELKATIVEERERNKKSLNNLENKIDICEIKISMICYRDLIKEIINYSCEYFGLKIKDENILWNKVKGLQKLLLTSKDIKILNLNEKTIFSQFIYISFLTLNHVNHNVHDGEEGYLSDYSISNFINCFKDYLELYLYDILKDKKKSNITKFISLIPQIKDIEEIIDKIGFNYVEDFDCEEL